MKFTSLTIIILFLTGVVFAQQKDIRKEILNGTPEFTISPNGNLSFVNEEGVWKSITHKYTEWQLNIVDTTSLDLRGQNSRISYFDNEHAIITGRIVINNEEIGYYYTDDGGVNWQIKSLPKETTIISVFTGTSGNGWMTGNAGTILFTSDYGFTWNKLPQIFKYEYDIVSIDMENRNDGILSADYGNIYKTNDNWQTVTKIEGPNDTKETIHAKLWRGYIIAKIRDEVFYTDNQIINWQKLEDVTKFTLNETKQYLFALTKDKRLLKYKNLHDYEVIQKDINLNYVESLDAFRDNLYVLDYNNDFLEISKDTIIKYQYYTKQFKIEDPNVVRKFQDLTWGISFSSHLYLSENDGTDWYRIDVLDILRKNEDFDFNLVNDSLAMFWNGVDNYSYHLKDNYPQRFHRVNPIQGFLNYSIDSFSIELSLEGCFGGAHSNIYYNCKEDEKFVSRLYEDSNWSTLDLSWLEEELKDSTDIVDFYMTTPISKLDSVLNSINKDPYQIPLISDFNITKEDKSRFIDSLDVLMSLNEREWSQSKSFYIDAINNLDTIGEIYFVDILNYKRTIWSTDHTKFEVKLYNSENDTLCIYNHQFYTEWEDAYFLPWVIEYKGEKFSSYSLALSKYIQSCIPKEFSNYHYFDNFNIIYKIAMYSAMQKVRREQRE